MNTQEIQLSGPRNTSAIFNDIYSIAPDVVSTHIRLTALAYCASNRSWPCIPAALGAEALAYLQRTFLPSTHSQLKNRLVTSRVQCLREYLDNTTNSSQSSIDQEQKVPSPTLETSINDYYKDSEALIIEPESHPVLNIIDKRKKLKMICNNQPVWIADKTQDLSKEISQTVTTIKNDPWNLFSTLFLSNAATAINPVATVLASISKFNKLLPVPFIATSIDLIVKMILSKKENTEYLTTKEACRFIALQTGSAAQKLATGALYGIPEVAIFYLLDDKIENIYNRITSSIPVSNQELFESEYYKKILVSYSISCIAGPILEELIFRLGIQDFLFKRLPKAVLRKMAPEKVKLVVNRTAKITRIFDTSILFGAIHLLNQHPNNRIGHQCFPFRYSFRHY